MINKYYMAKLLILALLVYVPTSFAETIVEVGVHFGGDELIVDNYSNGGKDSSKAGNLFSFAMGGTKSFSKNIDGQLSIGIRSDIVNSSNPEVTWIRYPLNAILFYRKENYRIGLGLTTHLSPKLEGNGVASNISETYKDALGGLVEVNFNLNKTFLWGLRYTNIKNESDRRDRSVSGSSLGVLFIALI